MTVKTAYKQKTCPHPGIACRSGYLEYRHIEKNRATIAERLKALLSNLELMGINFGSFIHSEVTLGKLSVLSTFKWPLIHHMCTSWDSWDSDFCQHAQILQKHLDTQNILQCWQVLRKRNGNTVAVCFYFKYCGD